MTRDLFHYEILKQFNQRYYKDVLNVIDIIGDEVAIRNPDGSDSFYFVLRRDNTNFLLPSDAIHELPIVIERTEKINFKGKAYEKITNGKSTKIRPERTMTPKEFVTSWMNYKHKMSELYMLHKKIILAAYCCRINIRIISFPCWGKDSPITVLSMLAGDVVGVNNPSMAKLKYLVNEKNKILNIREIQDLTADDKRKLAGFYEIAGEFEPDFVNPTRRTGGVGDKQDITNLSTVTTYNFPENKKDHKGLFDFMFSPKNRGRIFPLLYDGGDHKISACEENWSSLEYPMTEDEYKDILIFLRNLKWIELNWKGREYSEEEINEFKQKGESVPIPLLQQVALSREWELRYNFQNTRLDRNFKTILHFMKIFDATEDEFRNDEEMIHDCFVKYMKYIDELKGLDVEEKVEVETIQ